MQEYVSRQKLLAKLTVIHLDSYNINTSDLNREYREIIFKEENSNIELIK